MYQVVDAKGHNRDCQRQVCNCGFGSQVLGRRYRISNPLSHSRDLVTRHLGPGVRGDSSYPFREFSASLYMYLIEGL
jgi:hypothetical protein